MVKGTALRGDPNFEGALKRITVRETRSGTYRVKDANTVEGVFRLHRRAVLGVQGSLKILQL